ncbi:hypothetical protein [Humisphaera borealis]|uniref:Motility protein n=1 Tax=Humisphaera borealis TaxID=2807512 RepID=A0A7M2WYR4_9BACT|nr:hypothetical protein [Humisphaera borealis]QOV90559.1 hypothetical protein IPV69_04100 [Humisphaera borealis]
MDLVSALSSISQAQTGQAIQTKVAQKVMDSQRQEGEAALQLLAAAAQTSGAGDELTAKATGLGGQIDVFG